MNNLDQNLQKAIEEVKAYFETSRFEGIKRLYSARQVAEQQGSIFNDYSVAKNAASKFFERLRELYGEKKSITTFGPYSPSQAVMMKRCGIEGIYLGGWATSAKGSADEDPGADLASYPLSQVPNEAAGIVRALLAADKNQTYQRSRMTQEQKEKTPIIDYNPYIIADADTGHGGDAQVRNLVRRFVEVGVTGYHIEDQKPGTKKCGHQGGKVLVSVAEQIKRLNSARFQLDIMRVPGIIVARTDAEAASLLESMDDERDQPFVLGATNKAIPPYKYVVLVMQEYLRSKGIEQIYGHELYSAPEQEKHAAREWLESAALVDYIDQRVGAMDDRQADSFEPVFEEILSHVAKTWEKDAELKTYPQAIADVLIAEKENGSDLGMTSEEWLAFAKNVSLAESRRKATSLGVETYWDVESARTPEGYYQVKGGIPYAIAKSLAVAPYCDILWMETKTADLEDAKEFADAIHAVFPDKMLAYNLSPSFNWDSTGMTEEEMTKFPEELGKMGFVFNFITYGGHQIDGLASEEFSNSLLSEGMLALAKVQRKFRLTESPYKTPQTHVGGPRLDGALSACSGRTATTTAMGKGSTQFQHLIHTELPTQVLKGWLKEWEQFNGLNIGLDVKLRPHTPGSMVMELVVLSGQEVVANVIFTSLQDRNQERILTIRDQNTFHTDLRQKRLMTLLHMYLINRYKAQTVHYLTPTEDNQKQSEALLEMGLYENLNTEIGQIIVARVNQQRLLAFLDDQEKVNQLIQKAEAI